ncbi:heterokaryon incompatibility protein-domain-containing protein [Xylariales sp. PMI_506]|nr:heterokaryon incompatibility protein-domain-containing protein [Xylariales sp. PMI_506]
MPPYQYTPLKIPEEIRLITILPGDFDHPLFIAIEHRQLIISPDESRRPRYPLVKEVASTLPRGWATYTTLEGRTIFKGPSSTSWTHPDPSYNGNDFSKFEQPRMTEALKYLRYADRPRTMWIDAICINQNDIAERNKQVPRIGDIYKLALKVIAWTGPEFPGCDTACSSLEYLGRQVEFTRDNQCLQSPGCAEKNWYKLSQPLPFDDGTWESIHTLLSRPWFRRCWILQEIQFASAKSVIKCGVHEIPWHLFRRAVLTIENMDAGVPSRIRNLPGDVYRISDHIAVPFEVILVQHHMRYCSDPRDKIYALVSLAPKSVGESLCVDYSLPVMDVYKEACLACLRVTNRVDFLSACGTLDAKRPCPSPTWVPDWTISRPYDAPIDSGFCSSGISASQAVYRAPGQLMVNGLAMTSIVKTGNPKFEDFEDVINYLRSSNCQRLVDTTYCTGEAMLDAYLHIFSRGLLRDRILEPTYPRLIDLRRIFMHGDASVQGEVKFEGDGQVITEFWKDAMLSWLRSSLIFTTEQGYIGFSKLADFLGDNVFVILGCGVPIILRPLTEGVYRVIGSCFVHGLMDGEAILGPLDDQYDVITVTDSIEKNILVPRYVDNVTGIRYAEDPRLRHVPLPPEWQHMQWERASGDPICCNKFRNTKTDEIINYDPRLLPRALRERGINISKVTLV